MDFHIGTGVATFTSFMAVTLYLERESKWLWWQASVFAGVIMIGENLYVQWGDKGFGSSGRQYVICVADR
eukprot:602618-Prorocentrum_minimum.AAC.4